VKTEWNELLIGHFSTQYHQEMITLGGLFDAAQIPISSFELSDFPYQGHSDLGLN